MRGDTKRIFLIEDDPDLVDLISYNLKKAGYEVVTAFSGVQAIWSAVVKARPDCILLDLMMPSPDGYEICDFLKSSEDFRDIPIIIISARGAPQDIEKAINLGADVFLVKPFSIDSLLGLVGKYSSPRGEIRFPPP